MSWNKSSSYERGLAMTEFYPSYLIHGKNNHGTVAAAARRFQVATVAAAGTAVFSWVPGVFEAKSWARLTIVTSVGGACHSSLRVVLLFLLILS